MRPVCERHPIVFGASAPFYHASRGWAEVAGQVTAPRLVEHQKVVAGQTDVHIRVDTLYPCDSLQEKPQKSFVAITSCNAAGACGLYHQGGEVLTFLPCETACRPRSPEGFLAQMVGMRRTMLADCQVFQFRHRKACRRLLSRNTRANKSIATWQAPGLSRSTSTATGSGLMIPLCPVSGPTETRSRCSSTPPWAC